MSEVLGGLPRDLRRLGEPSDDRAYCLGQPASYAEIASAMNIVSNKLNGKLPPLDEICREPELVDDVREFAPLADARLDHVALAEPSDVAY